MNGAVECSLTRHGWQINRVWDYKSLEVPTMVVRLGSRLMIHGKFNQPLRHGFCRRPHKLLAKQ